MCVCALYVCALRQYDEHIHRLRLPAQYKVKYNNLWQPKTQTILLNYFFLLLFWSVKWHGTAWPSQIPIVLPMGRATSVLMASNAWTWRTWASADRSSAIVALMNWVCYPNLSSFKHITVCNNKNIQFREVLYVFLYFSHFDIVYYIVYFIHKCGGMTLCEKKCAACARFGTKLCHSEVSCILIIWTVLKSSVSAQHSALICR